MPLSCCWHWSTRVLVSAPRRKTRRTHRSAPSLRHGSGPVGSLRPCVSAAARHGTLPLCCSHHWWQNRVATAGWVAMGGSGTGWRRCCCNGANTSAAMSGTCTTRCCVRIRGQPQRYQDPQQRQRQRQQQRQHKHHCTAHNASPSCQVSIIPSVVLIDTATCSHVRVGHGHGAA